MKRAPLTRRWFLWGWLVLLVFLMLGTLICLAGREQVRQVQAQCEADRTDGLRERLVAVTSTCQTQHTRPCEESTLVS